MKKKTLGLVLAMAMVLSLTACGNAEGTDAVTEETVQEASDKADDNADVEEDVKTEEENASEENTEESADGELVLNAPVVIFDDKDITVTVNPIENEKFDITIVNNTASKIFFKYDFIDVNGYQIDDSGASSVNENATYDKIINMDKFFAVMGTDEVASVELQARLVEYATGSDIADIGDVFIKGEAYGNEAADLVSDAAMRVYSDNDIDAYIDPVLTADSMFFSMRGFTVNNSNDAVWCTAENFAFNGTPYDALGNFETAAKHRRFDGLIEDFSYSWIGLENVDAIETIEFDYTIGADTLHVTLSNNAGTLSLVSVTAAQ